MDQSVKKKNWWSRNWKWFVPVGCLTSLLLFVGFIFLIVSLVFGVIRASFVYQDAYTTAQTHPEVQAALGTPVDDGLVPSGSINTSGSSGNADIAIPISGPNGKGKIYAVATKSAGQWSYSTLEVEVVGVAERINLLE